MNELKAKINTLKSCIGKTDNESRKRFSEALDYLKENGSEDVQKEISNLLTNGLSEVKDEIEDLKSQIEDVYEILPLSYIARTYFHKSRAWLYQRLNGYQVRGRKYSLNEEEKRIFNAAMLDLSARIGSVQLS